MMAHHWHVLGAGAMGCLFGTAFKRNAGCPVTLILRQEDDTFGISGPVVVEREGRRSEVQLMLSRPADSEPVQHLLITSKAHQASAAVASLEHRLGPDSIIVLMTNGMGVLEELQSQHPQLRFWCATTTHGAYRIAPLHINHAGRGSTRIGGGFDIGTASHSEEQQQPPDWFEDWSNALENTHWDTRIQRALWRKLAINCAINPLTALHGCRNGELATRADLASEAEALCDEIALVCAAAGFEDVAGELHSAVAQVIEATATNRSSMLQDVLAGQLTEIDYITGYLVGVARQLRLAAPRNTALLESVHQLTR